MIEKGLSSKEIARELERSVYTIDNHRANILRKAGKLSTIEVLHDLKAQGLLG
jgi:DNA-binding NarL/FixJ family response regulator